MAVVCTHAHGFKFSTVLFSLDFSGDFLSLCWRRMPLHWCPRIYPTEHSGRSDSVSQEEIWPRRGHQVWSEILLWLWLISQDVPNWTHYLGCCKESSDTKHPIQIDNIVFRWTHQYLSENKLTTVISVLDNDRNLYLKLWMPLIWSVISEWS